MNEAYTTYIQSNMWSFINELDEEQEYKKLIDFLKSDEFRSFGDGIAYLINKKDKNADITAKSLEKYLKAKCETNGIDLSAIGSRNTFKGWFDGSRPDKKSENREKLFALSFALGLNIDEVKYLFHKVYLDRAFDYRNYKEAVYYYCIANGYRFNRAKEIIISIEKNEDKVSIEKKHTNSISREIEAVKNDEDLINWICKRWSNFQYNNETAIQSFKTLFKNAKDAITQEYHDYKDSFDKPSHISEKSTAFIYYIIFNRFPDKNADKKFNSVFEKGTNIHKEIKNNFPDINTFCEMERKFNSVSCDKNYDELRKNIILLKFYTFFRNVLNELYKLYGLNNDSDEYNIKLNEYCEIFLAEINDLLNDCGMCELYEANPYDLLFLTCMRTENPIDTLRGIVAEINYSDEE